MHACTSCSNIKTATLELEELLLIVMACEEFGSTSSSGRGKVHRSASDVGGHDLDVGESEKCGSSTDRSVPGQDHTALPPPAAPKRPHTPLYYSCPTRDPLTNELVICNFGNRSFTSMTDVMIPGCHLPQTTWCRRRHSSLDWSVAPTHK